MVRPDIDTLLGGDRERAHADDGGDEGPDEQQDALAEERLLGDAFILRGVDTGAVRRRSDDAHQGRQHEGYCREDAVRL